MANMPIKTEPNLEEVGSNYRTLQSTEPLGKDERPWGADDGWNDCSQPVFNLLRKRDPREEGEKDGFVSMDAYLSWSKEERNLYSRTKARQTAEKFKHQADASVNEITTAIEKFKLFSAHGPDEDTDKLIARLEEMKINAK